MRLIAIISIPVLMLADYYLTLLGKKLRDNVYTQHISSEQYELNPAWQKDINKFKLFNYKHLLAVILITGYLFFAEKLLRDDWFFAIYGAISTIYVYILMRHFQNILIYRFANKNPDMLSGKAVIGHIFSLKISQYNILMTAIMLIFVFAWTGSWFVLGSVSGLLLFSITQLRWINAYKRKKSSNT